jgi:pimeloyl-ACP methyl ester carboxylesterase
MTTTLPQLTWSRATVLRTAWTGCAAFAPLALITTVAVTAVPHTRGLGFAPALRYGVLAPVCLLAAVAAAFVYRRLRIRLDRRRAAVAFPAALALLTLGLMALAGPPGLLAAGGPAVLAGVITLAVLIPRAVDRPPGVLATALLALLAVLELTGAVAALASERPAPAGPGGMAFAVPPTMFDAQHRFVDLPGGARVHYVDEGTGPTLLFLHGNPAWSFQWRALIGGLRGAFRCVALDYPGFGLSAAPAGYGFTPREQSQVVEAFVGRLGLRDLTLVMQDWGGPIGLGLAERRPELVRAVVVGNSWAWPTTTAEPRGLFSKIAGGPLGELVEMNFDGFVRMALSHDIRSLPPETGEVYRHPFRPLAGRRVAAFYPGQITAASAYFRELEAGLPRLAARKALILWGTRDPGFPHADLARFEHAFPHHRTVELPQAGHFFFEDAPSEVIAEIRTFASGQ